MLVWLDLETTGLDAETEEVLEAAVIVTDDQLQVLGTFEAVTDRARTRAFSSLDPVVQAMHLKSGLWARSIAEGRPLEAADAGLASFVQGFIEGEIDGLVVRGAMPEADARKKVSPQLAGSTISFDRAFAKRHLPKFFATLHYRNLDVSTLNEVARRFWPAVYAARPGAGRKPEDAAHRALADIEASIAAFRYYLRSIVPFGTNARSSGEAGFETCLESLAALRGQIPEERRAMSTGVRDAVARDVLPAGAGASFRPISFCCPDRCLRDDGTCFSCEPRTAQ